MDYRQRTLKLLFTCTYGVLLAGTLLPSCQVSYKQYMHPSSTIDPIDSNRNQSRDEEKPFRKEKAVYIQKSLQELLKWKELDWLRKKPPEILNLNEYQLYNGGVGVKDVLEQCCKDIASSQAFPKAIEEDMYALGSIRFCTRNHVFKHGKIGNKAASARAINVLLQIIHTFHNSYKEITDLAYNPDVMELMKLKETINKLLYKLEKCNKEQIVAIDNNMYFEGKRKEYCTPAYRTEQTLQEPLDTNSCKMYPEYLTNNYGPEYDYLYRYSDHWGALSHYARPYYLFEQSRNNKNKRFSTERVQKCLRDTCHSLQDLLREALYLEGKSYEDEIKRIIDSDRSWQVNYPSYIPSNSMIDSIATNRKREEEEISKYPLKRKILSIIQKFLTVKGLDCLKENPPAMLVVVAEVSSFFQPGRHSDEIRRRGIEMGYTKVFPKSIKQDMDALGDAHLCAEDAPAINVLLEIIHIFHNSYKELTELLYNSTTWDKLEEKIKVLVRELEECDRNKIVLIDNNTCFHNPCFQGHRICKKLTHPHNHSYEYFEGRTHDTLRCSRYYRNKPFRTEHVQKCMRSMGKSLQTLAQLTLYLIKIYREENGSTITEYAVQLASLLPRIYSTEDEKQWLSPPSQESWKEYYDSIDKIIAEIDKIIAEAKEKVRPIIEID